MKKLILIVLLVISSDCFAQYNMLWYRTYENYSLQNDNYDNAYEIAQDNSGNVYVTGDSHGNGDYSTHDIATIKYGQAGDTLWIRRYNNGLIDFAQYLRLDNDNNVYVGGVSTNANSIGYSIVLIKYNSDGQQIWLKRYSDSVFQDNEITSLKIDKNGNIFISGYAYTYQIPDSQSTFILKYNPDGDIIWSDRMASANNGNIFRKINWDLNGNIFVTGHIVDSIANIYKTIAVKYDSSGNRIWITSFLSNVANYCYDIQIDKSGNIYTAGLSHPNGSYDFILIKFDSQGNYIWNKIYSNSYPSSYFDFSTNAIYLDSNDNIYAGMSIKQNNTNISDIILVKYDSSGNILRTSFYDNSNSVENVMDFVKDDKDNFYILAESSSKNVFDIFVILKYNADGTLLDEIRNTNQFNREFYPNAISVNINGDIAATGFTPQEKVGFFSDYFTIKYSTTIGIQSLSEINPKRFSLSQNYPNPFNPTTKISYELPASRGERVTNYVLIKVYDVLGNEVKTLVNQKQNAGTYSVEFNGEGLPSGVYFYKLESNGFADTKRMILLK